MSFQSLAEIMRPKKINEIIGLPKFLDPKNNLLSRMIYNKNLRSMILWGPTGTGKTSFAKCLANDFKLFFWEKNASSLGTKEIKEIGELAYKNKINSDEISVLFVDEIHRLNRTQQDSLLPLIENGDLVLIGATTEHPSYQLCHALISRCRVIVFERLNIEQINILYKKALAYYDLDENKFLDDKAKELVFSYANGDARILYNILEDLYYFSQQIEENNITNSHFLINEGLIKDFLSSNFISYDKKGDRHYDIISAFIKSIRGSDANAALYYLARMLKGGEDFLFIARRLIILASEDIGNASPNAINIAVNTYKALEIIGMPEGSIVLAHATVYLSCCPKSNRCYLGLLKAKEEVDKSKDLSLPSFLKSSVTLDSNYHNDVSNEFGKKRKKYKYPHDFNKGWVKEEYLPSGIKNKIFYEPSNLGYEKQIKEFLRWLKQ